MRDGRVGTKCVSLWKMVEMVQKSHLGKIWEKASISSNSCPFHRYLQTHLVNRIKFIPNFFGQFQKPWWCQEGRWWGRRCRRQCRLEGAALAIRAFVFYQPSFFGSFAFYQSAFMIKTGQATSAKVCQLLVDLVWKSFLSDVFFTAGTRKLICPAYERKRWKQTNRCWTFTFHELSASFAPGYGILCFEIKVLTNINFFNFSLIPEGLYFQQINHNNYHKMAQDGEKGFLLKGNFS